MIGIGAGESVGQEKDFGGGAGVVELAAETSVGIGFEAENAFVVGVADGEAGAYQASSSPLTVWPGVGSGWEGQVKIFRQTSGACEIGEDILVGGIQADFAAEIIGQRNGKRGGAGSAGIVVK